MAQNSILDSFLENQGFALFEYTENGVFRAVGGYPSWCERLWKGAASRDKSIHLAEASPLLESFLYDAESFWNSNREGSANSGVWIERDSSGQEVPLEASALHLDGKNILLLRNLSKIYAERQKLYQAARDALLEHERLTRETQKKEILLHCIVHDLSQPLTAMRGCFSLMSLEDLSAELRRMVETGQRESNRQEQMIRGILQAFSADLSGQQAGSDAPAVAADIALCAQRAVEEFSPAFAEKKIQLQLDVDRLKDWIVTGDESRLDRIFGNLLENALRYSPPNTTVTIGLEEKSKEIFAFVDDQGPGLPKDQSPGQMFALFAKGKDKPGKAGLGLYFCKITVERWGGTIGAETKLKGGTRFWFRLPRATRATGDAATKETSRAAGSQAEIASGTRALASSERPRNNKPVKNLRILVAEDTNENRELVTELLGKRGHSVVGVADGRQALAALEKEHFDVVLMDEQMPVMDGLEATRAIREKEKSTGKHQVIVALTGNITEEDREIRTQAGMDGFVPKPFQMNVLFNTVELLGLGAQVIPASSAPLPKVSQALNLSRPDAASVQHPQQQRPSTGGKSSQPVATPAQTNAPPSKNDVATHLLQTTGGNEKLAASLTKTFLADAPKRMSAITSAIAAKDAARLATSAHALKGSVAIFADEASVTAARNLETMGKTGSVNAANASAEFRSLQAAMASLQTKLLAISRQEKIAKKTPRKNPAPRLRRKK